MLQRIQSVYLLFVFGLMLLTLIFPLLSFTDGTILMGYGFIKEISNLSIPYGVACIGGLSALIAFIEMCVFKNRKLQMRLGIVNALLIVLFYITVAVYTSVMGIERLGLVFDSVKIGMLFPIIAFVLNILAFLKIKADEKLVRSLDRIR